MSIEQANISFYMDLSNYIRDLRKRKKKARSNFYQQTFHTHVAYNGYAIYTECFRPEVAVITLDEQLNAIDRRIEIAETKLKYWQKFLNGLTEKDHAYFIKRYRFRHSVYNDLLNNQATEEIREIEGAIMLRYGNKDEYTPKIELSEHDYMSNIDDLLALV